MPTAAVVVIGNEILTGKFRDENGPFFIERLRALGCDLVRIAVVRDEIDEIADEVRRCAAVADFVLTSGGVGPTHDDVTIEGISYVKNYRNDIGAEVAQKGLDSVIQRLEAQNAAGKPGDAPGTTPTKSG